jgi:hypothetical protein
MAKSVRTRLESLEEEVEQQPGNDDMLVVQGIGKSQEEIDREIARLRAAGHTGMILILDE